MTGHSLQCCIAYLSIHLSACSLSLWDHKVIPLKMSPQTTSTFYLLTLNWGLFTGQVIFLVFILPFFFSFKPWKTSPAGCLQSAPAPGPFDADSFSSHPALQLLSILWPVFFERLVFPHSVQVTSQHPLSQNRIWIADFGAMVPKPGSTIITDEAGKR